MYKFWKNYYFKIIKNAPTQKQQWGDLDQKLISANPFENKLNLKFYKEIAIIAMDRAIATMMNNAAQQCHFSSDLHKK